MTVKDPERDVTKPDPNNPEGEGDEGAANPESGERTVPLSAYKGLERDNQTFKTKLAKLEGLVEGLKGGQQKQETKAEPVVYTRAQLRAAVTAGSISEDQMDSILEAQTESKIEKRLKDAEVKIGTSTELKAKVDSDLAAYIEAHPELVNEGSDVRERVKLAYGKLIARGFPDNAATQLTAVENALGPITPKGRRKEPEAHEETGGSGEGHERAEDKGWAKGLTPKLKAHYQKMIDRGVYKGAAGDKALKAELDMARGKRH